MKDSGFWGSGWSFPPTFDVANNQLQLVHKIANINQSIDILLSTLKGERSMQPAFGCRLNQFLFKTINSNDKGAMIESVKTTLLDYEPRITVDSVVVQVGDPTDPVGQAVTVVVAYTVRKTNARHNHVFPFSLNEGSGLQGNSNG